MTRLRQLLRNYDHWCLPHLGDPRELDRVQRAENLAHVLAIKEARIGFVRTALPELDAYFAQLLDPRVHPFAAVRELDRWWVDSGLQLSLFPPVAGGLRSKLFRRRYYAANAVLANAHWYAWPDHPLVAPLDAMLRDFALVIGDSIVLRRPDFAWAVDEDSKDKRDEMNKWGRVVVMRRASRRWPVQAFDLFELARWSYSDLHGRKRQRRLIDAVDVGGGNWRGTFLGWTAVAVIDGWYTPDHYPQGRDGPAVLGRWLSSPAAR